MSQEIPIPTAHLFPVIDEELLTLLRSLSPTEWGLTTLAKKWTVKDIASHLLDGNIRTISMARDHHSLTSPALNSYEELVSYLNELNAVWVNAAKRISTGVLIDFLELTGKQYSSYMAVADPFADAIFSVAWAGEEVSKNWFHIAREYTEKVHHQLQIRDAVGKPGLMTKDLFYPFIDTFMYALPHTYRNVQADNGTTIRITVTTAIGGDWYLSRVSNQWRLSKEHLEPDASVSIDPDTAWKLFTKGVSPAEAKQKAMVKGDKELALVALNMISVMA